MTVMHLKSLSALGTQLLLLVTFAIPCVAREPTSLCQEFKRTLDASEPNGIERFQLEKSLPIGGNARDERYFNIDIDGDDISDLVTVSCPDGNLPADPCGLWIELSSGNKIEFHEHRFYLVRFHSKIYAVANHLGPKMNMGKRKIFSIGASGTKLICSSL